MLGWSSEWSSEWSADVDGWSAVSQHPTGSVQLSESPNVFLMRLQIWRYLGYLTEDGISINIPTHWGPGGPWLTTPTDHHTDHIYIYWPLHCVDWPLCSGQCEWPAVPERLWLFVLGNQWSPYIYRPPFITLIREPVISAPTNDVIKRCEAWYTGQGYTQLRQT